MWPRLTGRLKSTPPFVTSEEALIVDMVAQRYGWLPHEVMQLGYRDYCIDVAVAIVGKRADMQEKVAWHNATQGGSSDDDGETEAQHNGDGSVTRTVRGWGAFTQRV